VKPKEESFDLSADERLRLAAELGPDRVAALGPLRERLGAIAPRLEAWLDEDPAHRARFEADPVGTLETRFPELTLPDAFAREPRAVPSPVPERLRVPLPLEPQGASPEALDLFEAFDVWVLAAPTNEASYRVDAFGALRSFAVGRGVPPGVLDELVRALERVRDIRRLLPGEPFAWLREPLMPRRLP
jgi:hypothetical protein